MTPSLTGVRVVEFEGIGPGPFAGRLLADMGAEVTVIARPHEGSLMTSFGGIAGNPLRRGKTIVSLDLKQPAARAEALDRIAEAHALIEGNRPGVMERLGLGPADCAARNPRLVYGRMTGWGQSGPLAQAAGHDLNYVALSGLLSLAAQRGVPPRVPPTVVGDAAGALGLAFGMACALFEARQSGRGRVVDGAIVDVLAMLGTLAFWIRDSGQLDGPAASPFHDSPFYDVYACADGGHVTLGALEPPFYALLLTKLGLGDVDPKAQYDRAGWPELKRRFAELFAKHPRAHWCELLEGSDACFAPVLSIAEAAAHPHNLARGLHRRGPSGGVEAARGLRDWPLDAETP